MQALLSRCSLSNGEHVFVETTLEGPNNTWPELEVIPEKRMGKARLFPSPQYVPLQCLVARKVDSPLSAFYDCLVWRLQQVLAGFPEVTASSSFGG
jgi:hypothetical protein